MSDFLDDVLFETSYLPSRQTCRRWRAVVAGILASQTTPADWSDGTDEQSGETHDARCEANYPCHSAIVAIVAAPRPSAPVVVFGCAVVFSRTSLSLFRDWLDVPGQVTTRGTPLRARPVSVPVGFVGTARRIRGHDGSVVSTDVSVDWLAVGSVVGNPVVAELLGMSVSNYRRLDLLAGMVATGLRLSRVIDGERVERANRIGFGGCSDSTLSHRGESFAAGTDSATIVVAVDDGTDSATREKRQRLAESAELLFALLTGGEEFGRALAAGESKERAAKLAGIGKTRAFEIVKAVRAKLATIAANELW